MRLLIVASDRVSAFDVVMAEPVPFKGAVLTQLTAWWLRRLEGQVAHHMISADAGEIVAQVPALAPHQAARRSGYYLLVSSSRDAKDEFEAALAMDVDFSKVGEAFGAYGEKVSDPAQVPAAIERCLKEVRGGRTAILHACVTRL